MWAFPFHVFVIPERNNVVIILYFVSPRGHILRFCCHTVTPALTKQTLATADHYLQANTFTDNGAWRVQFRRYSGVKTLHNDWLITAESVRMSRDDMRSLNSVHGGSLYFYLEAVCRWVRKDVIHRESKKQDTWLLSITSPNIDLLHSLGNLQ